MADHVCSPTVLPINAQRVIRGLFCRALLGASVTLLAACGGGGGSSGDNVAPAPGPAPAPAPAPGPAPAPAAPQITAISPTTITAPARVTVSGSNLDRVASARLGNTGLVIAARTAASLSLDVPAGASTGFLTLVDDAGVARQATQQITVTGAVAIASFAPASVVTGGTLTINGSGLDRAASVEFAGGVGAPVASRSGSTSMAVVVPAGAQTGPFVVLTAGGDRTGSANAVTIIPRIAVTSPTTHAVAAGATVTLNGSGFGEVSGVTVGGVAATISARSATQLSLVVPAGVSCGAIMLQSSSQPAVSGGAVAVGGGCTVRIESIEFAQLMSQSPSDTRQRLVPSRETWIRAYVVASTAGVAAPTVQLTAFNGNTQLGTVTMSGPGTLPALAAGSALPDSLRQSDAQAFKGRLDETWVGPNLRVQVTVDPEQRAGPAISASSTPTVGTGTRIDLVLVPLVSGSNVPTVAANAAQLALDELTRRMPVARGNINVTVRAPYTLTTVTDGVDTSGEWSSALGELERLRDQEAPNRHYYGLVRPMVSAGTAGIGYVNRVGSSSPALASLGWDTSRASWLRTLVHELGHNFSREHAPCGGVANADASYPYANGALGPTPLFDVLTDVAVSPVGQADVMGYCSGGWFSDYNLREVQRFLEARPQVAPMVQALAASTDVTKAGVGEVLVVSGVIGLDGVRLAPVRSLRGTAEAVPAGDYLLRVRSAAGGVYDVPFDAVAVDHAMPPERHFLVRLPAPGPLAALEILRGSGVIAVRSAQVSAAELTRAAAAVAYESVESAGELRLTWDSARYPFATLSHRGASGTTVLAIDARGGELRVPTSALPAGGSFDLSLSDGLNTQLRSIAR
jgi:hypothetical protein